MRQLRAFYFALYAANGVLLPFFNLHLKNLHFSDWQIGLIAALGPLGRIVFPGFWGALADRSRKRNALLVLSCTCTTLAFAGVISAQSFAAVAGTVLLTNFFSTLTGPLVDASALEMARRDGFHFGAVRAWGSAGFIVAALLIGKLLDSLPTVAGLGGAWVAYAAMTVIAMRLPPLPLPPALAPAQPRVRRRDLLRQPVIALLLACGLLNVFAHGVYYNFFTIHLREEGYAPFTISFYWALAVAAEVWLIYRSGELIRRFGAANLIVFAMLAAALRWGAYALGSWWWLLLLMQPLHAFTFGAFQMAAMDIIHERFPAELKVSGQSYFTIASWGAGYMLGALFAGWANHVLGVAWSFASCAGVALLGAGLALGLRAPEKSRQ